MSTVTGIFSALTSDIGHSWGACAPDRVIRQRLLARAFIRRGCEAPALSGQALPARQPDCSRGRRASRPARRSCLPASRRLAVSMLYVMLLHNIWITSGS